MKLHALCWLMLSSWGFAAQSSAQAPANPSLNEAALLSLYGKRHEMTIAFAGLATSRATDGDVRKAAENLARAHREARDRLEKVAKDKHLTLTPPAHDTTTALLEQARAALEEKTDRAFDSTWANLALSWLTTLILDNNVNVKPKLGLELQPIAREHTTWLFHQSADLDKLGKKFK